MRIQQILSNHRTSFRAVLECEHCNHVTGEEVGQDSASFYEDLLPNIPCPACARVSGPLAPTPADVAGRLVL